VQEESVQPGHGGRGVQVGINAGGRAGKKESTQG